jgi:hypothetical protein
MWPTTYLHNGDHGAYMAANKVYPDQKLYRKENHLFLKKEDMLYIMYEETKEK